MIAALISLAGVFVALYLMLYKLGYIGTLVCAVGSCEVVQTSKWATLLGVPVAGWGVAYYAATLVVALVGLTPSLARSWSAPWSPGQPSLPSPPRRSPRRRTS